MILDLYIHVSTVSVLRKLLKNACIAWKRGSRDLPCKQAAFSQQECHCLNIQEQAATSYRLHRWFMYMQGTRACMIRARANCISKWLVPATLARKMHVFKPLVNIPSDTDPFVAIMHTHRD